MVPAITAGGRSFRGAALYYLHDKRQDGEAELSIGKQSGPRIGMQKGPLTGVGTGLSR